MSVYFIQAGEGGRIKVGYSPYADQRIAYLQRFSGPNLIVLAVIEGSRRLESYIHQHLSAYRAHGEWFEPTPEVLAFAQKAAALPQDHAGSMGREDITFTAEEIRDLCSYDGVIGAMAREVRRFPYSYNYGVLAQLIRLLLDQGGADD